MDHRKVLPILGSSLVLGFLFNLLFFDKLPGISIFLYTIACVTATVVLTAQFRAKFNKSLTYVVPLIVFFSAMTFIRASGFLTFLNVVFLLYLLMLLVQLTARPNRKLSEYRSIQYLSRMVKLPFQCFQEIWIFMKWALDSRTNFPKKRTVTPVIRGILLSLPFLIIFLLLFASADLVFKKYVNDIFRLHISGNLIFQLIIIAVISLLFVGVYAFAFLRSAHTPEPAELEKNKMQLGTTEASIILGSVSALFLIFILVQITYFFGGSSNIVNQGITYSDYARRGFFELLLVAVLSWALIWAANQTTKRRAIGQKVTFMWLNGILVLEVFVIMLSAVRRLSLYEEAYGFTSLRLFSHLFIGWLAVAFILVLLHIFREQKDHQFAFQFFLSIAGFLILLNLINPDAMIARQNIQRFYQTGKLDIHYLISLSDDATPQVVGLLKSPDQTVQKSVAKELYDKQQLPRNEGHWQSYHVARSHAKRLLAAHAHQIEENKTYTLPSNNDLQ